MRLVLIAVDGAEPTLIEKWDLRGFKQRRWGVYESTVNYPTPRIWASIITGVPVERSLKIDKWVVPKHFPKLLHRVPLATRILGRKWVTREFLAGTPLFDEYPSIAIDFPAYNWRIPEGFTSIPEAVGDPRKSGRLMKIVMRHDMRKVRLAKEALKNNLATGWRLLAVWLYSADVVNHLFWRNRGEVRHVYLALNVFLRELARLAELRNAVTVVLSDHGGLRGLHTANGFVSASVDVGLPRKLGEVYGWLKTMLENQQSGI